MKNTKKRVASALLAALLLLCLAGCGGKTGTPAPSGTKPDAADTTTPAGSGKDGSITPEQYNDAMNALDLLTGEDERLGKEFFKFPAVTNYSELPDPSVWTEMGMIDLTPEDCESGSIYDDGTTILDGMWNGYTIECKSSREAYEALIHRIWDAGYRGIPAGNGVIIEADSFDEVYDDYLMNFGAFYEYEGWTLYVEANYYEWDDNILCGVVDAKTMINDHEELIEWAPIRWEVTAPGAPKSGLEPIGSDFHGIWGEYEVKEYNGNYMTDRHLVYATGVSPADFAAYTEKLDAQEGVYVEADYEEHGWEDWSVYYEEENADGYWYVSLGYCEKAGMVCWSWD